MPHAHIVAWDEEGVPNKRATSYASAGRTGSDRTASGGGGGGWGGGFGGVGGRSPHPRPAGASSAVPESKDEDYDEEEGGDTFGDGGGRGVTLTLGRKHDLRNVGALPVLRLSLWGREMISKDKPLGVGLVDLASLPADGKASVTWEALEPATGMDPDTACGRCVACARARVSVCWVCLVCFVFLSGVFVRCVCFWARVLFFCVLCYLGVFGCFECCVCCFLGGGVFWGDVWGVLSVLRACVLVGYRHDGMRAFVCVVYV